MMCEIGEASEGCSVLRVALRAGKLAAGVGRQMLSY